MLISCEIFRFSLYELQLNISVKKSLPTVSTCTLKHYDTRCFDAKIYIRIDVVVLLDEMFIFEEDMILKLLYNLCYEKRHLTLVTVMRLYLNFKRLLN